MKKANNFLTEIKSSVANPKSVQECYIPVHHQAKKLDEYMKEQYFIMLFRAVAEADGLQEQALNYILAVAEKAEFQIVPEDIVKYVFTLDEKKMQDCILTSNRSMNVSRNLYCLIS
ncbi:MAG: hypothetical protein K2L10_10295 [Ruminococcus sp.]|nr:hypothetical protein [Ruminococcus sp.]